VLTNHTKVLLSEIEALTGVKVGHTSHQRLVLPPGFVLAGSQASDNRSQCGWGKSATALRAKTRLQKSEITLAVRLQGMYYGAFFGDNQCLIDYVNSQPLACPLVCLGDGHEGIWNLVKEFVTAQGRCEILDWYHRTRKSRAL
jgi:hypothetical protein